ncbi:hypothetical protein SDC9_195019 [bioreactor metagenome]|uniref:Uncharacterized protein n=1 Tax=bioreactor metagenome TaxID=1076179 RepID=A0A645I7U0_9ZZZZ
MASSARVKSGTTSGSGMSFTQGANTAIRFPLMSGLVFSMATMPMGLASSGNNTSLIFNSFLRNSASLPMAQSVICCKYSLASGCFANAMEKDSMALRLEKAM